MPPVVVDLTQPTRKRVAVIDLTRRTFKSKFRVKLISGKMEIKVRNRELFDRETIHDLLDYWQTEIHNFMIQRRYSTEIVTVSTKEVSFHNNCFVVWYNVDQYLARRDAVHIKDDIADFTSTTFRHNVIEEFGMVRDVSVLARPSLRQLTTTEILDGYNRALSIVPTYHGPIFRPDGTIQQHWNGPISALRP